jgi:LCP family protein required for cell wall assembly
MATKRKASIDRLTYIVMGVFVVLAVVTGVVAFGVARDVFKSWTSTSLEGVAVPSDSQATQAPVGTPLPGNTTFQTSDGPTPTPWDGKNRVTVLVMGLDYRDWEAGGPPRTDTMILFTLDPVTNTAGILSIPRDMWVNIPGYDYYRINQAYFLGEADQLPGGGPALAMETVRQFLGVDINYYAQVDFYSFVKFVDILQGVKLDIPEDIKVSVIDQPDPVTIEAGRVTLPGDLALAYARARYTEGSDFDRAKRQQQVIMAVRDRVLDFNMLPTLIARSGDIYNELSAGIRTNMTMDDIMRLAYSAIQVPKENIKQAQLGVDTVQFANVNGADVLIPITDKVREVRDEIFTSSGPVGPVAVAEDSKTLAVQEQARISLQNGSGNDGIAATTATWLTNGGLSITDQSNADGYYDTTTFYVYNGKPYTLKYLSELMGIENPRVYNRYDPNAAYDIAVVLGADWANSNPMQ